MQFYKCVVLTLIYLKLGSIKTSRIEFKVHFSKQHSHSLPSEGSKEYSRVEIVEFLLTINDKNKPLYLGNGCHYLTTVAGTKHQAKPTEKHLLWLTGQGYSSFITMGTARQQECEVNSSHRFHHQEAGETNAGAQLASSFSFCLGP